MPIVSLRTSSLQPAFILEHLSIVISIHRSVILEPLFVVISIHRPVIWEPLFIVISNQRPVIWEVYSSSSSIHRSVILEPLSIVISNQRPVIWEVYSSSSSIHRSVILEPLSIVISNQRPVIWEVYSSSSLSIDHRFHLRVNITGQCAYFSPELWKPFSVMNLVIRLRPRYHQSQGTFELLPVLCFTECMFIVSISIIYIKPSQ